MKLILYSLNYSPELTGIGKYNGEMCPELVKRGVEVNAIVAPPYYPEWEVHSGYSQLMFTQKMDNGVKVTRCPLYVPKNTTTIKRLVHLCSFAFTSGIALISSAFSKPDVIMIVQPTLFCAPIVLLVAKVTGAKSIMHVQDYEIDAMFGLNMMGEGKITRLVKGLERWIMQRFDAISTISYSMIENAKTKGVNNNKIILFPNWSDTEFVTPETCGLALKIEWGFELSDKVIMYAGNIGNKQGLEIVLDAAKYYENSPELKFVLVGAGSHVNVLEQRVKDHNIINVYFKPLQPWEKVPQMLALATIHLVIQKKAAADAVLPSKLTNILSAGGHALVTAEIHTELGKISVSHAGVFTRVEPEDITAFIAGLNQLLEQNLTTHNIVAREFAKKYLAKDKILDQFVCDVGKLIKK